MTLIFIIRTIITLILSTRTIIILFLFFIINLSLVNLYLEGIILENKTNRKSVKTSFNKDNIVLSSAGSNVISVLTLTLLLFIYTPDEWFRIANILTQISELK